MYTIMLVEDETTVREGIVQKINWSAHGFTLVCACENGKQAMAYMQKQPVDVVITDINMPVMDGLALAEQINKTAPRTIVVILTGFGDFSYAQTAIKYRVQEYILKPITARQLCELLDKLKTELDQRKERDEDIVALREEVVQAYPLMRERFLSHLCRTPMPDEEAFTRAGSLSLHLIGTQYCAVLMDALHPSGAAREALFAVVNEQAKSFRAEVFMGENERIVALLGGDNVITTATNFFQAIQLHSTQPFFYCVGNIVQRLGQISQSYADTISAWEYLYSLGANRIVMARETQKIPEKDIDTGSLRRNILRNVRLCDQQESLMFLDQLFITLQSACLPRSSCIRHLHTLSVMLDEYIEEAEIMVPEDALPRLFASQPTLSAAHGAFRRTICAVLEALRKLGYSTDRQAAQAVDFIKQNYKDPKLSLQVMTELLSVSTSHFSSIFKNYTGVTFIEFLTRLRMNKAQDLLISTDMRNYEIADAVGFDDPSYFSSAFKKFTGMKPTQYRKHYRTGYSGGNQR